MANLGIRDPLASANDYVDFGSAVVRLDCIVAIFEDGGKLFVRTAFGSDVALAGSSLAAAQTCLTAAVTVRREMWRREAQEMLVDDFDYRPLKPV